MWNMMKNTTSSKKFFNWNTIYGKDGEHATPYQTRITIGRLRLHIFHRGDADPDCHNHPWDFWTFPLTSYVEEVAYCTSGSLPDENYILRRQVVPAFMLHYRRAGHTHRVLGRYAGTLERIDTGERCDFKVEPKRATYGWNENLRPAVDERVVVTIVWRGKEHGKGWGFLKERLGKWCRVGHKEYIWGGGKEAPCGD